MTMQMQKAFNVRMETTLELVTIPAGSYDSDNNWVPGVGVSSFIKGVCVAGNKFSQFDEGIALRATDGGARYGDYRSLYVRAMYEVNIGDKIIFRDTYYNVLQESDEFVYGFSSFLLEKSDAEDDV